MKRNHSRRKFIQTTTLAGIGLSLKLTPASASELKIDKSVGKRIGIIGLDTSHTIDFAKAFNSTDANADYGGYRITAAYPYGSKDIESSTSRIPKYIKEIKEFGVQIKDSIADLLNEVDVVLLETNDGRLHLEQTIEVLKAGKRVFIDKPVAASLKDVVAIFAASKKYNIPVFSSSSLRYISKAQEVYRGKTGKVLGAETYSPAILEKTHSDLFWYGIHGVEMLFTVMGKGCKTVTGFQTKDTEMAIGIWEDGRIGSFRGTRSGLHSYGGTVFTEDKNFQLGTYEGNHELVKAIVSYFDTGVPPVSEADTLEIYAFMEAASLSKRKKGKPVSIESIISKAKP